MRTQSAPSVAHWLVWPDADRVPISAPIPSNWPDRSCRPDWYSSGVRYAEYGSSSDSTMPRIAPRISACWSTSPPA